ncbi:hypothetical protein [uncultured Tateyamaria sp.]|uniref:hypothetical protein n=1 Tax=uncultured Tateyamaria sp. TaxID=455651 RepID=UPI00261AE4EB|nr:hypothetical protein [uncultured Tateyamaria sp.]
MKRTAAVCALVALVAACGDGNPFTDNAEDTGEETPIDPTDPEVDPLAVPAAILGDLESISFNADDNTLTVTGLTQEGTPFDNSYTAVASSFAPGYQTFTAQNDAIGRHATAFVASRDGVQAGMVLTGPQFNEVFGGTFYERDGEYVAPTAPESRFDVTYFGNYAAGLNGPGPETDLLTQSPGVDPDVSVPTQAAYITGLMFINVDLNDFSVEGEVFDRTAFLRSGTQDLPDIVLIEGTLTDEGTFSGNIELDETDPDFPGVDAQDIGDFAGVIGGPDGNAVAGGTTIENFSDDFENEIEFGVFVLDLCDASSTDPICVNALQP